MIELAKKTAITICKNKLSLRSGCDQRKLIRLKRNRAFTKAVSNMAIMDITDIEPLFMAVYELLRKTDFLSLQRSTLLFYHID